jgi:hypothetical protein
MTTSSFPLSLGRGIKGEGETQAEASPAPSSAASQHVPPQEGRCARCPTPDAIACRGIDVRRFCDLIDPACPQYDPGYIHVILRESYRAPLDMPPPRVDATDRIPLGKCCGGNLPPGAYF